MRCLVDSYRQHRHIHGTSPIWFLLLAGVLTIVAGFMTVGLVDVPGRCA